MFEQLRHGAAKPVFVDSSAVIGYYNEHDEHHEDAVAFFRAYRNEELRARPLYSSEYVLSEVGTTLLHRVGHERAARAVEYLRGSRTIRILHVDPATVDRALDRFVEYDDQALSVTDHVVGVQAIDHNVDLVFSFDRDFGVLGLTTIPE